MSAEDALNSSRGVDYSLIETLRWEPDLGFRRLEGHLARLSSSARVLGFQCDARDVEIALIEAVASQDRTLRVRLVLATTGKATVSVQPFEPVPAVPVWNLRIAKVRLSSENPLIRHKTTRRDVFVIARSEYDAEEADEVLLLNERGEVCEGTISNVFVDDGEDALVTPALSCGLLPGVLRAELIAKGRAREAVLDPAELMKAKQLFVGNSLRGLIPARLCVEFDRRETARAYPHQGTGSLCA